MVLILDILVDILSARAPTCIPLPPIENRGNINVMPHLSIDSKRLCTSKAEDSTVNNNNNNRWGKNTHADMRSLVT